METPSADQAPQQPGTVGSVTWNGASSDFASADPSVTLPFRENPTMPTREEVLDPGRWYARYTFDPERGVLELDHPIRFEPPDAPTADEPNDPAPIAAITIDFWGTAVLERPLQWTGGARGVVAIDFKEHSSRPSGPIGNVTGP